MKIEILSMQDVFNFGSLLQAYGLKKTIEELVPDATVCYLPIKPNSEDNAVADKAVAHFEKDEKKFDKYFLHRFINKYANKKQNGKFIEFQKNNFTTSPEAEIFDLCIIGSDEVFNCSNADSWGFTTQLFGNVENAKKVITYAASCGFATVDLLNAEMKSKIAKAFTKVSAFSVRDFGTQKFVSAMTDKPIEFHLDPVLITNFDVEIENAGKHLQVPENLCIVYSYHNRICDEMEIKQIKQFAKNHGMKLVTIGASQKWISNMLVLNPFEVLYVFSKAGFVITDTFHGTIFASKYNGKFATLLRESNNNKLSDLVDRLHIRDHVIPNFSCLEKAYIMPDTKDRVNDIVACERTRTRDYLMKNFAR